MEQDKYIVIKRDDLRFLINDEIDWLDKILVGIKAGRSFENRPIKNNYWVCNQDEPYAKDVIKIILDGEKGK